jgi:hypothetical protein
MTDSDGPRVAAQVYRALLGKSTLEMDDIPYILDAAARKLREDGASAGRWAAFVHVGA